MEIKKLITQDYIDDLSVRLSHHSTAIEGNKISYSDTATIILEGTIPNSNISKRDFYEIDNHIYAINLMFELLNNDEKLNLNIIKELNEKLMYKLHHNAGKFKENNNAIKGADFNTASVEQTPILMYQWLNNLDYRLTNTVDKIEKLKIILEAHIDFERIHPFADGNGRTGRLIMIYLLLQENIIPFIITVENRNKYIDILRKQDVESFFLMAQELQDFEEKKIEGLLNNICGNFENEKI